MEPETIKNKGRGRIFENDFLEFLYPTNPLVIFTLYFPLVLLLISSRIFIALT